MCSAAEHFVRFFPEMSVDYAEKHDYYSWMGDDRGNEIDTTLARIKNELTKKSIMVSKRNTQLVRLIGQMRRIFPPSDV